MIRWPKRSSPPAAFRDAYQAEILGLFGQAVKGLSAETRAHDDSIPWRQIAGMRDKLIHEYFGVDLKLVWDVVERELPTLRPRIAALLEGIIE
jgi:uncharacterized protein with HEPN domain